MNNIRHNGKNSWTTPDKTLKNSWRTTDTTSVKFVDDIRNNVHKSDGQHHIMYSVKKYTQHWRIFKNAKEYVEDDNK